MSAQPSVPRLAGAQPRKEEQPAGIIGLAAMVLAISVVPYLCGYLLAPPGLRFLGALNNVGDLSQYLAAIRQGGEGAWRYTNQFTPDQARPLVMYSPYLLAGHLSLGLPPAAVFQILRLLCAGLCLFAIERSCRLFLGLFALRAAWLLVVLAGGLYWLDLPLSGLGIHLVEPAQLTAPEYCPLLTILISPHESLGLAAELLGFVAMLRSAGAAGPIWSEDRPLHGVMPARRWPMVGAASLWFLVLALSYPFLLPTVGLVLVAYAAVTARGARRARLAAAAPKRRLRAGGVLAGELRAIGVALAPALVVAIYYWRIFGHDPLWSRSNLTQIGHPDLPTLLLAFGPLVLASYAGSRRLRRMRLNSNSALPASWVWFPVIWAVVNCCTLLLPIWQQGRQTLGLSIPLALLGFLALAGPQAIAGLRRTVLPALPTSILAFSAPLLLALYTAVTASGINHGYYVPREVIQAVGWLGDHTGPEDVVLSSAGFGNLVPVSCACRVVIGQNFQSFDWQRRQAEVHQFYAAVTVAAARQALAAIIAREHVTYVVYGPFERSMGHIVLRSMPGFTLQYRDHDFSIYSRTTDHR